MQGKSTLVFGLLALTAVPLSAEDPGICRAWNKMGESWQLGYLAGFVDGLSTGAIDTAYDLSSGTTAMARAKKIEARYVGPSTLGEVQDGITAICKRPENSLIGISDALEAFTMQVKGKPQSEIDLSLDNARQAAIKHQDSDKPNK